MLFPLLSYRDFVLSNFLLSSANFSLLAPLKNDNLFCTQTSKNAGYNSKRECSRPSVCCNNRFANRIACLKASASDDFDKSRASFAAFCRESENSKTFFPLFIKSDFSGCNSNCALVRL